MTSLIQELLVIGVTLEIARKCTNSTCIALQSQERVSHLLITVTLCRSGRDARGP